MINNATQKNNTMLFLARENFTRGAADGATIEKVKISAAIAINDSLKVKRGEQVFIIANPAFDSALIAQSLYDAASESGANVTLIFQNVKSQIDFAEKTVIAAFGAKPDVVISISSNKLGKDEYAIAQPYQYEGKGYDHIFHLLQYGEKITRAFWSPSITLDMFIRTVPIDYALLKKRCLAIGKIINDAVRVRVTSPAGTDITLGLNGRLAKYDDGDFSDGGAGGNLPAGEVFVSPENNTAEGVIVFDGTMSVNSGDLIVKEPIVCTVVGGFVTDVKGGREADALMETITLAEINARAFEESGKLPRGKGEVYARNARNIGELGIGLNPAAQMTGNLLEDEKLFKTCHFAIGQNYDEDAPALIHLDGLVKDPTITAFMADGSEHIIEKRGELVVDGISGL